MMHTKYIGFILSLTMIDFLKNETMNLYNYLKRNQYCNKLNHEHIFVTYTFRRYRNKMSCADS